MAARGRPCRRDPSRRWLRRTSAWPAWTGSPRRRCSRRSSTPTSPAPSARSCSRTSGRTWPGMRPRPTPTSWPGGSRSGAPWPAATAAGCSCSARRRARCRARCGARRWPGSAPGRREDLAAIERRAAARVEVVQRVGWRVYDGYLRSQGVAEGLASYSRVVELHRAQPTAPPFVPGAAAALTNQTAGPDVSGNVRSAKEPPCPSDRRARRRRGRPRQPAAGGAAGRRPGLHRALRVLHAAQRLEGGGEPRSHRPGGAGRGDVQHRLPRRAQGPYRLRPPVRAHDVPGLGPAEEARAHPVSSHAPAAC